MNEVFEFTRAAFINILDSMRTGFEELKPGFVYLFRSFENELSQVQGGNIVEQGKWVVERFRSDATGRTLWTLAAVLFGSGIVFLSSVIFGFFNHETSSKVPPKTIPISIEKPRQSDREETIRGESGISPPGSVATKSKSKVAVELEASLLPAVRRSPDDFGSMMYLFACRAVQDDAAGYDSLVREFFPDGLDEKSGVCRHIGEIGRILSPGRYSTLDLPEPEEAFSGKSSLVVDSLATVSDFGDVSTLLDLIRAYINMDEIVDAERFIIEVLVRGNTDQRKRALEFAQV